MNYISANKTKITGALLVLFGFIQTQSETLRALLTPERYAWVTMIIGGAVAVLGFLNSGGSITPPGESRKLPSLFMALLLLPLMMTVMGGCTGTRAAYSAAKSPDAVAYVVAEQYAASVKEAADLAAVPTTPRGAVSAMQSADRKARPLVEKLRRLRNAYLAARSAENEAQLQSAVNDAVLAVADLLDAVKRARGAP